MRNGASTATLPYGGSLLLSSLSTSTHDFLQPTSDLHTEALTLTKQYLDPLAAATSKTQQQRLQDARRKKRKRGEVDDEDPRSVLQLKELHLQGFHIDQVWEQVKRALEANTREVETVLKSIEAPKLPSTAPNVDVDQADLKERLSDDLDEATEEEDGDSPTYGDSEMGSDYQDDFDMEDEEESMPENEAQEIPSLNGGGHGNDGEDLHGETMDIDGEIDDLTASSEDEVGQSSTYVPDKHGLNDGFFSIDEFNRQSDFLERQDARGEDDGAASDEEDVDWGLDPSTIPNPTSQVNGTNEIEAEALDEEEEEDDGPTFGNADLDAPDLSDLDDAASEADPIDDMGLNNTNDIKYADFFAPPPRKLTKSSRMRALPKTQPMPQTSRPDDEAEDDQDRDMQRTISAVRRDIFEDDLTPSPPPSPTIHNASSSTNGLKDKKSTHETRQAALTAEIRRLEAAALKARPWQLRGEARASDRPLNSLLEEDLDFERAGKPIPIITQAVSEDIESLIKRRILAREFDEVVRRRPGTTIGPSAQSQSQSQSRRGLLDAQDQQALSDKPTKSLADQYEESHLRRTAEEAGETPLDPRQKQAQEEITALWKSLSSQLDALTSWHFTPKPPDVNVRVVSDAPALTIEDARPAGVDGIVTGPGGGGGMLAPQEVYRPGDLDGEEDGAEAGDGESAGRRKKSEVRTKGGAAVGREEMDREQRRRRRRREKERTRKAGNKDTTNGTGRDEGDGVEQGDGKGQKKARRGKNGSEDANALVASQLKRSGNVKVIGKKGELRDVDGRVADDGGKGFGARGAGKYKL